MSLAGTTTVPPFPVTAARGRGVPRGPHPETTPPAGGATCATRPPDTPPAGSPRPAPPPFRTAPAGASAREAQKYSARGGPAPGWGRGPAAATALPSCV